MNTPIKNQAMGQIPTILANFLEIPEDKVTVVPQIEKARPDIAIKADGYQFLAVYKSSGARAPLLMALQQITEFKESMQKKAIPLIVVPYMGKSGIEFCRDNNLSWLDLSGNAHIKAQGLIINVEGRPNRFKTAGRPSNVFAPKSARITRRLLLEPEKSYNQRALSQITGLDEGHTSKIVRRLEELQLVVRDDQGSIKPSDPNQLLDAWQETYDLSKHQTFKGHIAARSGDELLNQITETLTKYKIDYAATGLAAAWQYTHFARFRLISLYFAGPPDKKLIDQLHFREDERGANTWLIVPNDTGVFHGSSARDGIECVHPVQIYLDLQGHPERAKEAAATIRKEYLNW